MRQAKKRIWAGAVCEQIVYNIPESTRNVKDSKPRKPRFETPEEKEAFCIRISRRLHARYFNANFSPSSLYSTLTFAQEYEVHDFEDAKKIRKNWIRRLKRKYPEAVIFCYIGRGKATNRVHFHMVSEGIPKEEIERMWNYGSVCRIDHLREHNYYNGVDRGQDYTGLANYLFDHWTPEQGGHRWYQTRNARKPETEPATEVKIRGGYTADRPPMAPKGYTLVETTSTQYGCLHYIYVAQPKPKKRKRPEPDRPA